METWEGIIPQENIYSGADLYNLLDKDNVRVDEVTKRILLSPNYNVLKKFGSRRLEVSTPKQEGCGGEIYPSIFFSSAIKSNLHCMHPDYAIYLRLKHKKSIFVEEKIYVAMEPIEFGGKKYIFYLSNTMPKGNGTEISFFFSAVEFSPVNSRIEEGQYFVFLKEERKYP